MNEFDNLVQALHQMGPPKHRPNSGETWDMSIGTCVCGRTVPLDQFLTYHTGLIPVVDGACPACRHATKDMAKLVCARCRAVVARIDPNTDPTGFKFETGKSYHMDCCAICEPELVVENQQPTFILEMLAFMRKAGKPIPEQWSQRQYKKVLILSPAQL